MLKYGLLNYLIKNWKVNKIKIRYLRKVSWTILKVKIIYIKLIKSSFIIKYYKNLNYKI